jgi:NTP pyrophosphatase (non-canonical NTP hydrolase)
MIRKDQRSSCLDNYKKSGVWAEFEELGEALLAKNPTISNMAKEIHINALNHGWWEDVRPIPELLCLIHAEVSEALEAYRKEDNDNLKEELADIMIRVMDMAVGYGIDIEAEIIKKHEYNKTRSYRHGGKKC